MGRHSVFTPHAHLEPFSNFVNAVAFLAVKPPPASVFHVVTRGANDEEFATAQTLITAETETVEFMSTNQDQDPNNTDYSCQYGPLWTITMTFCLSLTIHRYMAGVFDKSTNELTLRHAPLYVVRHQVKTLKGLEPITEAKRDDQHARNVLGEAFGTKKAKAAIRSAENNKVDVEAMKGVRTSAGPLLSRPNHPFRSRTLFRVPSKEKLLHFQE